MACILAPVAAAQTATAAASADARSPAVALVDAADAPQWQTWAKDKGWRVLAPAAAPNIDARVQAIAAVVEDAVRKGDVDPARIYLAGRGAAVAAVFYTISRMPDLWAAAIAIEGGPRPAIDTDRIFAANFANVPILWVTGAPGDEALAGKLNAVGFKLEWRADRGVTNAVIFDWLSKHTRDEFPAEIDCETNSPTFSRCYWIQMSKFDPGERNDVLPTTRLAAATPPTLDLGAFNFKTDDPGPGLLVSALGDKYSGPLKVNDRILQIEGRPIENPAGYLDLIAKYKEEKPVAVTVQRGKERIRVDTRVVLPRHDNSVTARVEAQFLPADREIQIVSRTVKEMRVTIPPQWAQDSKLLWNGLVLEKIEGPGCLMLTIEKELLHAARCQ